MRTACTMMHFVARRRGRPQRRLRHPPEVLALHCLLRNLFSDVFKLCSVDLRCWRTCLKRFASRLDVRRGKAIYRNRLVSLLCGPRIAPRHDRTRRVRLREEHERFACVVDDDVRTHSPLDGLHLQTEEKVSLSAPCPQCELYLLLCVM